MTGLIPTAWRSCSWPGCATGFDIAAVMNGDAHAQGWVGKVLSLNYLCPAHARAGHLPHRIGHTVGCQCGTWTGSGSALAEMRTIWQDHVHTATGTPT